ncbi:MAG: gamma-glutamyl-gamma-aminobutyrate hydrolase family protein [Acidimicrobiales bacterium]
MVPLVLQPGRRTGEAKGPRDVTFSVRRAYAEAVHRAGGRLLALPPIDDRLDELDEVLGRIDGVLLHGGGDVEPARYGASEVHPTVGGVDPVHDAVELAGVRAAIGRGIPVLAICRGHQVLNVALGGTLHQDLGAQGPAHRDCLHEVTVVPGTRLAGALGVGVAVGHSWHHQAIDRLGDGLVVSARAPDGTVEAVELPGSWVLGVQWHPEDTAATDPVNQRLFDGFVAACRR